MKRAPRSLQHHVLYRKYNGQDSEISALLGKCGIKRHFSVDAVNFVAEDEQGYLIEQLVRLELCFSSSGVIEISEFDVSKALETVSVPYRRKIERQLCQYQHDPSNMR